MRRMSRRSERGATAVLVAALLVGLIGSAAIAVDLGALWVDRIELQNGADAAALGAAQDCGVGNCAKAAATAQSLAAANKRDRAVTATIVSLDTVAGRVTVETRSERNNAFASLFGIPRTTVTARATAKWGYPKSGKATPLAFSLCEFKRATGGWSYSGPENRTEITIRDSVWLSNYYDNSEAWTKMPLVVEAPRSVQVDANPQAPKDSGPMEDCTLPSGTRMAGAKIPGGHMWLYHHYCSDDPQAPTFTVGQQLDLISYTHRHPNGCNGEQLQALQGTDILVAIWDSWKWSRTNPNSSKQDDKENRPKIYIYGWAVFHITGYNVFYPSLTGESNWNCGSECADKYKFVKGYFTKSGMLPTPGSWDTTPTAPPLGSLGAAIVGLES